MKTVVGAEHPEDPYAAYRTRYTSLMKRVAGAMRASLSFGGRQ